MSTFGFSCSPIKRRQGGIVFSPSLSPYKNGTVEPNSPSQTFIQQRSVPFQQFIVCSPLVCRTKKLKIEGDTSSNSITSTSYLDDTDDVPHMLDSFDIGYNPIDPTDFMPSKTSIFDEQAPLLHDNCEGEGHPLKESRSGTRTRNNFQTSRECSKIWEDIAPPCAATSARHSAVKASSTCFNDQASLGQSVLKHSLESAGGSNSNAKSNTMLAAAKSPANKVSFESNLFHFYKLKRNNTKRRKSGVSINHRQIIGPVSRVAVTFPYESQNSRKSINPPLPIPNSNCTSGQSPGLPTDNAWKQQCLDDNQSLLDSYMKSDYFKVDTTHDHMPIRVNPERIYQRLDLDF